MRPTKSLLDSLGITEKEYWADKPYGDTPPGVVTPGRIKAAKEGFKFINQYLQFFLLYIASFYAFFLNFAFKLL